MKLLLSCIWTIFIFHHVSARDSRILGGTEVQPNELKYTVAIASNGQLICGGSIIGSRYILTAAHCLIDEKDEYRKGHFQVVAGSTDLTKNESSRIVIDVRTIYTPLIYNGTFWQVGFPEGDIAVLRLRRRLPRSFDKLKLPVGEVKGNESYIFETAVVSGYGLDKVETAIENGQEVVTNASTSLKLYKAKSLVFDHIECRNHYQVMYESNLCGKVVNVDEDTPQGICDGDSGGPLVFNGDIVIGVVSGSSTACNENEYPSVYTHVGSYLSFVQDVLRGRHLHMRVKRSLFGRF